jgi:hypothetical protein
MTITPMMQYIQDRILEAVHPWLSIDEAQIEARYTKWCLYSYEWWVLEYLFTKVPNEYECFPVFYNKRKDRTENWDGDYDYPIIWLPPTLSRVLTTLWDEFYCWNWIWHAEKISNNYENRKYVCQRKLLKDSWEDCNLFDQSQETITTIWFLLGWKENQIN